MLAPPIVASESGSWPTSRGQDSYERRNWKTVQRVNEEGGDLTLPSKVAYLEHGPEGPKWTTPTRDDANGRTGRYKQGGTSLSAQQNWPTASTAPGGSLGEPLEKWRGRALKKAEQGINLHKPLHIAVQEWPTATRGDHKSSGSKTGTPRAQSTKSHTGTTLTDAANGLWASPQARDWRCDGHAPSQHERNSPNVMAQVVGLLDPESLSTNGKSHAWPTAQARDYRTVTGREQDQRDNAMQNLNVAAASQTMGRGVLNSRWVAQLMSFPSDWCVLPDAVLEQLTAKPSKPTATRSSRPSSRASRKRSSAQKE